MEYRIENQARGTRIVGGAEAVTRRKLINAWANILATQEYNEVILPTVEKASIYTDKAGPEILNQMYVFADRKNRQLCLRPEGTATCQLLAKTAFKRQKDVKLWYDTRCYRYEQPQAGRYREFSQVGVEVLWPKNTSNDSLLDLAKEMLDAALPSQICEWDELAKRGLAYYTGAGFECKVSLLGAQKQILGGGSYQEGIGFAFGLERVLLARKLCLEQGMAVPKLI